MKIRPYKPGDRRLLWELYNRFLHRDRLPEKAFLEYLLIQVFRVRDTLEKILH